MGVWVDYQYAESEAPCEAAGVDWEDPLAWKVEVVVVQLAAQEKRGLGLVPEIMLLAVGPTPAV